MYIRSIDIEDIPFFENIFSSKKWLSIFNGNIDIHGIFNKDNSIIGFFYTSNFQRKFNISQISNAVYTPNCSLYFLDETINKSKKNTFYKKISQTISEYLLTLDYGLISISLPEYFTDMQPFIWGKYKVITRYTYHLDLSKDEDVLLQNMSKERRKNIRKAQKDNIVIKQLIDNNIENYSLIVDTFLNQGIQPNEDVLKKILFEFSSLENSFSFIAYKNKLPIATTFCVYDKEKTYYLFGGYDKNHSHEGAGALCMWNSVLKSKELGVKTFDFEGSMIPSIEKYFRGFGGDVVPYFSVNKGKLLYEMLLKFKERSVF